MVRMHIVPSLKFCLIGWVAVFCVTSTAFAQRTKPVIVNHRCRDITLIPESALLDAKERLHIAYGHTSHGSQLTTGMTGLVEFANSGGLGLSLPADIFAWNEGGTNGALDLRDYAMAGDVGYYPDWVNNTYSYLGSPDPNTGRGTAHPDVNVIIWSWCGQVASKYTAGTLESEYLTPMSQLEEQYPGVTFVYMTGHVDHYHDAALKAGNQIIRDFCITNNKVLYDFAMIETFGSDGTFFEYPSDNCDFFDVGSGGTPLGNWALEYQTSHTEGEEWFDCTSAHSQALNANYKAYAAWWLWAILAGWDSSTPVQIQYFKSEASDSEIKLLWNIQTDESITGFKLYRGTGLPTELSLMAGEILPMEVREYTDRQVQGGQIYYYQLTIVMEDGSELRSPVISERTDLIRPALDQNYPNPFNPVTNIEYQLPDRSKIALKVYDITGALVRTLVDGIQAEGTYKVIWDARDASNLPVSSGLYFYRLETADYLLSRKMILLR